jgi:acid phosphatase
MTFRSVFARRIDERHARIPRAVPAAACGSLLLILVAPGGCASRSGAAPPQAAAGPPAAPALPAAADTHENLNAVVWQQTAIEYQALARQAYAAAAAGLDRAMADPAWSAAIEQQGTLAGGLPPAVIVDVDETVVDNSAFQARLIQNGGSYSEPLWRAWVEERAARAVPGALEFARAADARGVTIFYVTNRDAVSEPPTRENLQRLGFPLDRGGRDTVLTRGERPEWSASEKSPRRALVAKDFRILLLIGDDLGDFLPDARGTVDQRAQRAGPYQQWWGTRWIVLPNPMYGSWELAVMAPSPAAPADATARKRAHLRVQ